MIDHSTVKKALQFIEEDHDQTTNDQIEIKEIPAPTFHEKERGMYFMDRLKEFSLEDIKMDEVGNVYGIRKGTGNGPKIFVSAHMDNVFSLDTDTTVKKKDGILYAPGIGDDARGMAEVLSIIRAFEHANIEHTGDIIFGSTVCEEGLGNLKGVRHFFKENNDID